MWLWSVIGVLVVVLLVVLINKVSKNEVIGENMSLPISNFQRKKRGKAVFLRNLLMNKLDQTQIGALLREFGLVGGD